MTKKNPLKARNYAVLIALLSVIALLFFVTIVKISSSL